MIVHPFFFYLIAAVMVLAALAVVLARNPLYNVLALVVVIFSLSSLFVILEAYFVGIILLLVYAGAVTVFFLFVVMCLNITPDTLASASSMRLRLCGWLIGLSFLAEAVMAFRSFLASQDALQASTIRGTIEAIGQVLFTEYLLPFELTSLLLLIGIFGIVSLAKGAFSTGMEEGKS